MSSNTVNELPLSAPRGLSVAEQIRAHRPWSLAVRLAVGYGAAAFTLLLLALAYAYWVLADSMSREDVTFLSEEVQEVVTMVGGKPEGLGALREHFNRESEAHQTSPLYLRVLDLDGHVFAETAGMSAVAPPSLFPAPPSGTGRVDARRTLTDGHPVHVLATTVMVDGRPMFVQGAVDRTIEQRLLSRFRKRMLLVLSLGLAACALIGFVIARRGLRPLNRMAAVMERVSSSTLDRRVDDQAFPGDLSSLAATFNSMLQRLEDAFGRLSRFSADIAHELRTPIHNVRGMVELALTGRDKALLVPCLEECQRISRLIENLLFIARAEHPQTQIARQPVNVAEQLAKVQEFYEAAASEAGITLECGHTIADDAKNGDDLQARLDRQLFQQAVSNLVENALAHTPPGGHVRMIAARRGDVVQVEVCDTGAGIASEHLPFVFDRFRRVDASRSKHTGGMGLGLALVKSIAQLHGGNATAESQVGAGSRFILTFPVNGAIPNAG